MMNFKIYNQDNKEIETKDFDLGGTALDGCKIVNTGAIIEAECVEGAIISIKDNDGNDKVLVIRSQTPLLVQITE